MTTNPIEHLFPDASGISNGVLKVGEHFPDLLAHEWGTPLYVYHARTFYNQVEQVQNLLTARYPGPHGISYAGKAYFSLHFARKLQQCGLNLDAVSLGEMMIARKAGFSSKRVYLHGNNKTEQELRYALDWGVANIVVDSLEELEFLEHLASSLGRKANIWLRITPNLTVQTHAYVQTAHISSKFGLHIDDGQAFRGIQRAKNSRWLQLTGLHIHIGSQIFEIEPYLRALRLLIKIAEDANLVLEQISPGGGWGVPYVPGQEDINLSDLITGIAELLVSESERLNWPLPQLVVEPGRRLIARAGISIYQVGTKKQTGDGRCMVSVDGGMADNPRPALYDSQYTAMALNKTSENLTHCILVGKYCESGDELISSVLLPELKRGDLIAIPVSGAYQLSMASNYNLSGRPAVLWLEDDQVELMQPREVVSEMKWWSSE